MGKAHPAHKQRKLSKQDKGQQFELLLGSGETSIIPRTKKPIQYSSTFYYLGFFSQLGTGIALPIAIGALVGSYVDRLRGTHPRAVLIGIALGFALSILYFVRTVVEFIRYNTKQTEQQ